MADIRPVLVEHGYSRSIPVYKWGPLVEADTIFPLTFPQRADMVFETEGINGHTVTLTGSGAPETEGTTPKLLKDGFGNDISFTADDSVVVAQNAFTYLPTVTGGGGNQVTIYLMGS